MKDLSYIVPSKNDDYDPQNLEKLILTINTNVKQLTDLGIGIQTVLIDWCSEQPFHTLDRFKNEIKVPVSHVYIDKSLLESDGLNPKRYYEYFAKNVGIRQAEGKYVLIENSDILNDEELAQSIKSVVTEGKNNYYFRPSLRVNVWYPDVDEYTHYNTIDDKPYGDLNPGDFMLATREDWVKAQGYDETNQGHRGLKRQTNMDVEMLAQFVKLGINVDFLKGYYRHMDHDRKGLNADQQFGESALTRNLAGYTNRETWGFTNATVEEKDGIKFLKV
jgi:hypothetical protein